MLSGTGGVALASVLAAPALGLGSAANFQVLGGSTVTNTGASVVAGELGTSPGTTITGFPPGIVTEGGKTHMGDVLALQAQNDVALAYNSSAGQPCNTHLDGQELGGKTLTPDVYCFSSLAQLTGQLVLDAKGNTAAVWIIQIPGGLSTASNSSVVVTNGGGVCNVFWIVGESATIGAGSSFAGNILALTSITLAPGANLSGRAFARNGAVTLDTNTISKAPCSQAPAPTPVPAPSYVSVDYQCADDSRVVVNVGLTAGVIVTGLGEDITSATGTGNNPIVRYLSPGYYEWRASPPTGSVLDVNHGVVDKATCSAPAAPTPASVPTVVSVPVVIPATGADLGDARVQVMPPALGVSLGLLSLGFLGVGLGLILFAVRRK
jgi:type VI secretion system secreted protein VgrG